MDPVRLSVLDRSRTREGHTHPEALRDTVRLARELELLGYHRVWVSEHHGVPGVAGSAPTVLAAAVAGATRTIRVGTGGVMLPNHRPLVVAEQFGVLESLFPGRIDMGLGRSVGFTDGVRRALGRDKGDAEDFEGQLAELLGWFRGTSPTGVHARPAEGLTVPPFVLAMGEGAGIAARAGLPMVIGDLRNREKMRRGIDHYRDRFRPSAWAPEPYVVISGTIAVAATPEEARRLQRALAQVDPFGDLLDAVGRRALRCPAPGEDVEHLEVAGAQPVAVQRTIELALGPRVQRQNVPPLFHERLLGLLSHAPHRNREPRLLHLN
ncbi:MsnO8 family LLM class oxidoreductase [Streptomyces tuirus]|uniref:Luciferase-like domain-containing protein n=1 Tax=Streptomyces tuirus TaxID=68278 RepID=A0A7G1N975_9ACTN|nr:MsnO8 family LLM class oxidoreductase [Streptomyces tuirus]BCL18792.1 hypothetical protein GCM10017668_06350 [Streptomyces tuirus]